MKNGGRRVTEVRRMCVKRREKDPGDGRTNEREENRRSRREKVTKKRDKKKSKKGDILSLFADSRSVDRYHCFTVERPPNIRERMPDDWLVFLCKRISIYIDRYTCQSGNLAADEGPQFVRPFLLSFSRSILVFPLQTGISDRDIIIYTYIRA